MTLKQTRRRPWPESTKNIKKNRKISKYIKIYVKILKNMPKWPPGLHNDAPALQNDPPGLPNGRPGVQNGRLGLQNGPPERKFVQMFGSKKHVPASFFRWAGCWWPPQMRGGDAKMTPKATKNNKREVFCYVQKIIIFIGSNAHGRQRMRCKASNWTLKTSKRSARETKWSTRVPIWARRPPKRTTWATK